MKGLRGGGLARGILVAWWAVAIGLPGTARAVGNGAQAGTFLLISHGARATGMGEAFSGLADDVTAISWDPAGLVQLPGLELNFSYANWFADTSYSVVALGGPIAPGHALAASLYYFNVPRIANVPADVEPPVDLSNYAVAFSYALGLTERLSLGTAVRMLNQDLIQTGRPSTSAGGALVDLALQYRNEDPDVSGAIVLQNMGPQLQFRDAASPSPFWLRLGGAWRAYHDEWLTMTGTVDIAEPMDTGWQIEIPDGGISQLFNLRVHAPAQNRYNYGMGLEATFAEVFSLRAGYTVRIGTDISTPSVGAGLKFAIDPLVYGVDYAYSYWSDLSANVSRVSLSLTYLPRRAGSTRE